MTALPYPAVGSRSRHSSWFAPGVISALVLCLPPCLAAQVIVGHVVHGPPKLPVAGAFVLLVDDAGSVSRIGVTDSLGAYVLLPPGPGNYRLQVERGGFYAVATDVVSVVGEQTVHLELYLPQRVYSLKPITIVAPRLPGLSPMLAGYYQRKAKGWGYFIGREEIEKRGATRLSDVLHGIPDVEVIRRSDIESTLRIGTEVSRINLGPLSLGEDGAPRLGAEHSLPCSPLLYVDGMKFGRADEVLDQVQPPDIEGIEIYRRASEVPPQFGGIFARCGVILVWTRRGPSPE